MPASSAHEPGSPAAGFTQAEWALRCELAACYRHAARFQWSDLAAAHISARVAHEEAFLISALGLHFHEVTATSLIKVGLAAGDATARRSRCARPATQSAPQS